MDHITTLAVAMAERLVKGVRTVWYSATRRVTFEEQVIIRDIIATCERLELKGFLKEHLIIVSLESLYVPLIPTGAGAGVRGTGGTKVALTNLITRYPRLVVVGEAGSGKTTFLKHVALTAAKACINRRLNQDSWLPSPPPLPLFLPLHGFSLYLADQKTADRESPSPDLLRGYVAYYLRHLDLPESWIAERLKAGNVLLLLDGLDAVARSEDRRFIAELITRFADFYDHCKVVVTTRPQGYEGVAQLGGDFERRDINPLEWPEDIQAFLYRWSEAINRRAAGGTLSARARRQAHENTNSLMARLEAAANVRELANNPLLLTVMAIVHYNVGALPERRADLYNAATELLLGWDKRMGREALAPPAWLDVLSATQRRLPLEELAFDFQERRELARDRSEVRSFLVQYFIAGLGAEAEKAARSRAAEYLAWVTNRTYVLQDIGGVIRFYRKSFQEYLAARHLARLLDLRKRVREILAKDWQDRWWYETLLLATSHLVFEDPQKARDLLTYMQSLPDPPEIPHYNATLVARALADAPEGLLGSVWEVKENVANQLAEAVASVTPAFAPRARQEAALALGALGDPRPGVGVNSETGLPDILWVDVPAGSLSIGSTDEEIERWKRISRLLTKGDNYRTEGVAKEEEPQILCAWLEGERGGHRLELPAFLISRYAVTNAQYACFTAAGGYDNPSWWGGEDSPAWAWRQGQARREWQRTDRPDFWHDPRFNGPNQPVVGVTWYEAMAFCRWLTEQYRTSSPDFPIWRDSAIINITPEPETVTVRLPTEVEWEKAARSGDRRTWPWGEEWEGRWANTLESDLGQTLPVGILPGGDSPFGVADMAGNVGEWTTSLWGPDWRHPTFGYPYQPDDGREGISSGDDVLRVVRGGSWSYQRFAARCAARYRYVPVDSMSDLGFRCVLVVPLNVPYLLYGETRRFLARAGFTLQSAGPSGLLCTSDLPLWSDTSPFYVHLVLERALDLEEFRALCMAANTAYGGNLHGHAALVVIDRAPRAGDLYQIFALRAQRGLTIIPLPRSLVIQAQRDAREMEVLREQMDLYTGRTDLYDDPRTAVTDVLSFFGRSKLLADLEQRLIAGRSVVVFGMRKVGKSSLLGRLREECDWPVASVNLEGYIGGLRYVYREALQSWRAAIQTTLSDLPLPEEGDSIAVTDPAAQAQAFRQTVQDLLNRLTDRPGCPGLLLFLDEIEYLLSEPEYFYLAAVLRSIAEDPRCRGRFALLMAGLEPTLTRTDRMGNRRNPFYAFFGELLLGPLELEDARTMVVSIGGQMGISYEDEALNLLVQAGGGHPFLTRQLCSRAVQDMERPGKVDLDRAGQAVEAYLCQAENYFANSLWGIDSGGPPSAEAALLRSLAAAQPQTEEALIPPDLLPQERRAHQLALEHLRDQSLIRRVDDGWELTIPLYRRWIRRYVLNLPDDLTVESA